MYLGRFIIKEKEYICIQKNIELWINNKPIVKHYIKILLTSPLFDCQRKLMPVSYNDVSDNNPR